MGLLQRPRRAKAAHDRDAALRDLREASSRFCRSVAHLARVTQDWSAAQASLALDAASASDAVSRARHTGGTVAGTVATSARDAQRTVSSTARTVRKRGLRLFDLSVAVGLVLLRRRLQATRAARRSSSQPSSG